MQGRDLQFCERTFTSCYIQILTTDIVETVIFLKTCRYNRIKSLETKLSQHFVSQRHPKVV